MSDISGEVIENRIQLRRTEEAKRPIVQRLNRIEGQVRGLRGMIEEDRYCLDEVQQINAITAALREVALVILSQHVTVGVRIAAETDKEETAISDVMRVLRAAMQHAK